MKTGILAGLTGLLCYLAAKLGGILIITEPQTLWPLWPGCAVLAAVLLACPKKTWLILLPAGLAGFIAYDLQAGVGIRPLAWLVLADVGEILAAAWGVNYVLNGAPRLDSLRAFAKYSVFAVILGPFIASSIGIQALNGDRWISWRINVLSEGLAFLTVTPAILGWVEQGRTWLRRTRAYHLEAVALVVALISLCCGMFLVRGTYAPPALRTASAATTLRGDRDMHRPTRTSGLTPKACK